MKLSISIILLAAFYCQSVLSFRINNFGGKLCDNKYAPVRNGVNEVLNKLGAVFLKDFCPLQCSKNICQSSNIVVGKRSGYNAVFETPEIFTPMMTVPQFEETLEIPEIFSTTPETITEKYAYETTTPFIPRETAVFTTPETTTTTTTYASTTPESTTYEYKTVTPMLTVPQLTEKYAYETTTPEIVTPIMTVPQLTEKYAYETTTPEIVTPMMTVPQLNEKYAYETTTPFIPRETPVFTTTTPETTTTTTTPEYTTEETLVLHYNKKRAAVFDTEKLFQIEADLCDDKAFEHVLEKFGDALRKIQNDRFLQKACELQEEHNICECE